MIVKSPEIWHRDDFSLLCNWRRLWRFAVEIGVDRGEWAQEFLRRWQGDNWYGIDPYSEYHEMPWDRHADYLMAIERLVPYARVAKLVRCSSKAFSERVLDAQNHPELASGETHPQFVYLDGCHQYESVSHDIHLWWPLLHPQGILAGHDYDETHPGVMRAVQEFSQREGVTVYIVKDERRPEIIPSWYVYKSGLPGSDWKRC